MTKELFEQIRANFPVFDGKEVVFTMYNHSTNRYEIKRGKIVGTAQSYSPSTHLNNEVVVIAWEGSIYQIPIYYQNVLIEY